MNISKISMVQPLSFEARTKITAPDKLLTKDDKSYFKKLGEKLGTSDDSIQISVGKLHHCEINPAVEGYNMETEISMQDRTYTYNSYSSEFIPFVKNGTPIEGNSPKEKIQKTFNEIIEFLG